MVTAAEFWSRSRDVAGAARDAVLEAFNILSERVGDWMEEHEAILGALCVGLILLSLLVCLD